MPLGSIMFKKRKQNPLQKILNLPSVLWLVNTAEAILADRGQ